MKKIKFYSYEYKYLKNYIESKSDSLNIKDNDLIYINAYMLENNKYGYILYSDEKKENKLISFENDDNEFTLLLKGLGKIFILSEILVNMPNNEILIVDDASNQKIGFHKLISMNDNFIIIGGFNYNIASLIQIEKKSYSEKLDKVRYDIFKYFNEFCNIDYKTMILILTENIAGTINVEYFKKPYIIINKKDQ